MSWNLGEADIVELAVESINSRTLTSPNRGYRGILHVFLDGIGRACSMG
jgi:hypothetical protein